MDYFGCLETGGTKFVCAIGKIDDDLTAEIVQEIRYPTTTPVASLERAADFFREMQAQGMALRALGIGSFGPVDPRRGSPTFGYVTATPKPGWRNTDVVGFLRTALPGLPIGFDTDVNAAALGEHRWGAARGLDTFVYLTIGTGIGGGVMVNGSLLHGLMHSEMGHIRIPHDWQADPFPGVCPYHGDCLEGLATGPALEARWKQRGETLPQEHPAWALEAHYLALGIANLALTLAPQRIVLGGSVAQPQLFPLIRREVRELLNGYIQAAEILEHIDDYIVEPGLGLRSGVMGALALAQQACVESTLSEGQPL